MGALHQQHGAGASVTANDCCLPLWGCAAHPLRAIDVCSPTLRPHVSTTHPPRRSGRAPPRSRARGRPQRRSWPPEAQTQTTCGAGQWGGGSGKAAHGLCGGGSSPCPIQMPTALPALMAPPMLPHLKRHRARPWQSPPSSSRPPAPGPKPCMSALTSMPVQKFLPAPLSTTCVQASIQWGGLRAGLAICTAGGCLQQPCSAQPPCSPA